jgi:hypothetical protein
MFFRLHRSPDGEDRSRPDDVSGRAAHDSVSAFDARSAGRRNPVRRNATFRLAELEPLGTSMTNQSRRSFSGMATRAAPVRPAAVSLAVSGALVACALPLHPSILDRSVDAVVRDTPLWEPIHVALMLVVALAAIGAGGLVAVHGGALGRLGRTGLILTLIGSYAGFALSASEAFFFPAMAAQAPGLLQLQGPHVEAVPLIGLGLLSACWPVGLGLLGLAAARAAVFPRFAGIMLAGTALAFLGLGLPFVPIAGVLSELLFGAVQVWWGVLLWRAAAGRVATPKVGSAEGRSTWAPEKPSR